MSNVIQMRKNPKSNLVPMLTYKVLEKGYTPNDIAMCMGTKENTWFRRKRQPDQFRLSELQELSKRLDIDIIISNGITSAAAKEGVI